MQKLTTLDFPGVVSALVFTQGCNFHCPYCHNAQLIPMRPGGEGARVAVADVLALLRDRADVLDGLVISGGEPCLHPGLEDFCRIVKDMGYKIKLDTNGYFPAVLQRLLASSLLDYVAVDVKAAPRNYAPDLCPHADAGERLAASLAVLGASSVPCEMRTTCVAPFVDEAAVRDMAVMPGAHVPWFFQRALLGPDAPPGLRALDRDEMAALLAVALPLHPLAALR